MVWKHIAALAALILISFPAAAFNEAKAAQTKEFSPVREAFREELKLGRKFTNQAQNVGVFKVADPRHQAYEGRTIGEDGLLPNAIRSLWHYMYSVFTFHSELTNAAGNHRKNLVRLLVLAAGVAAGHRS